MSDLNGATEAAPTIPTLESALGFHPWRALSSIYSTASHFGGEAKNPGGPGGAGAEPPMRASVVFPASPARNTAAGVR